MILPRYRSAALFLAVALGGAGGAQAHMPYVLPTLFDVGKADHITVESSFAEDPFHPEVAMRDAPFHLIGPDGAPIAVGPVTHLRDLTVFEADIKADGTYRVTSGQRLGRKSKMVKAGDKWVMQGEGSEPRPGEQAVEVQSATLADAYVTRGQPTDAALKPIGKALEIQAITHPNAIASAAPASFVVLFEGKPLSGTDVTLFRSAGYYDGRKVSAQLKTDAKGGFSLTPPDAGTYLILVRHRTAAPTDAATPWRSYTYTLTFDAA